MSKFKCMCDPADSISVREDADGAIIDVETDAGSHEVQLSTDDLSAFILEIAKVGDIDLIDIQMQLNKERDNG